MQHREQRREDERSVNLMRDRDRNRHMEHDRQDTEHEL